MDYDAEGSHDGDRCPECGSANTITWHFREGFDELECRACGYRSDAAEISALRRDAVDLLRRDDRAPLPRPGRPLKA